MREWTSTSSSLARPPRVLATAPPSVIGPSARRSPGRRWTRCSPRRSRLGSGRPSRPRGAHRRREPWCRRDRGSAVLRVRHRRCVARCDGGRHAHCRLGPVCVQRGPVTGCRGRGAGCGNVDEAAAGLPGSASVGFVTGAQAANTVGLAVGRQRVLADAGWDVARDGLFGAPRVAIVASEERHATIDRAARLLGFGTRSIEPVAATAQGTIDVDRLRMALDSLSGPVIVCLQAGNVNTGACDNTHALAHDPGPRARSDGVPVDGAFGLWAPRALGPPLSSTASSSPTPGARTPTSGSTSPTTAVSRSARTHRCMPQRCRMPPRTSPVPAPSPTRFWAISPPSRPEGQGDSRCGPRCVSSVRTAWPSSWTGAAPWPVTWPFVSRPAVRRSTTTSSSTRSSSASGTRDASMT